MRLAAAVSFAAMVSLTSAQEVDETYPLSGIPKDTRIRVKVVDGEGNAVAGIRVAAVFPIGDRLLPAVLGTSSMLSPPGIPPLDVVAETDAAGECTLELLRAGIPLVMFAGALGVQALPIEVCLAAPFPEGPLARFVLSKLPREPVRLECPPSRPLTVRLIDGEGAPETRRALVGVSTLSMGEERRGLKGVTVPCIGGTITLPRIGLSQRIQVAARVEGESAPRCGEITVPGNAEDSSALEVVLRPSDVAADVDLVARVTGPDGRPLSDAEVTVALRTDSAFLDPERESRLAPLAATVTVKSGEDGRIRASLGAMARADPWVETRIRIDVETGSEPESRLEARLILPRGLTRGVEDLGVVPLSKPPVLATGAVLAGDMPIAGARLRVEENRTSIFNVPLPDPAVVEPGVAFDRWVQVGGLETVTGADGTFVLRGAGPAGPARLVATRPGFRQVGSVLLLPGSGEPAKIVMTRAHQLAGRVLLDPGIRASALTVTLDGKFDRDIRPEPTAPGWSAEHLFEMIRHGVDLPLADDGSFSFDSLPGGLARIQVLASNIEAAEVADIALGEETSTPTVVPDIDLRGRLSVRRIKVLDAAGRPVRGATVYYSESGRMRSMPVTAVSGASGVAEILTVGPDPIELFVVGPRDGHWKSVDLKNVGAEATAILEPEPRYRVRITVTNPGALPRPPYSLACVLDPAGRERKEEYRSPFGESEDGAHFDGNGVAETWLEQKGPHDCRVMVWALMPDCGFDVPIEFSGPRSVTIEGRGEDAIEITIDPDSVSKAVESAARFFVH